MNLKALITTIVLGTSSIASAAIAPTTTVAASQSTWFALTDSMPLSRGRDVIRLGKQPGTYTQLRFQATQGASRIERVIVRFMDGTMQTIDLVVRLDASTPMVQFTLDGPPRQLKELIVIGASSRRSAVQLFGA